MEERLEESPDAQDPAVDGKPREPALEQPSPSKVTDVSASTKFCIVGVGASAGGLEALEKLFEHMPPDAGMAFVVIQHLSPDFKSLMDELLARRTELTIHRVEDGMTVEPNAIYLIPPKKEMIISGGRLLLSDKDPNSGLSLPIDTFFRSLARDLGERAVGIILSGTGSDGSRGIRAIHEAGGLVIVQSEETAKFDGMPRSAVETGVVDLVLSPAAMVEALLDYIQHPLYGVKDGKGREKLVSESGMNAIYSLLRAEGGIDFSHYKPNTVLRRIDRRLQLNRSLDLDEYINQLRSDRRELNSLYKDLLIGVTRFFRDPELFARLQHDVIPHILAKVPADEEIRVWVAGCATGEEAYSLAILFYEAMSAVHRPINVKIFATDVHRASLETASQGVYDESALTEVSHQRLERYFTRQAAGYQVSQELRKMIVFAPHNIIKDAPFTKLDLISCRNLLIYLQTHAQKKALSLFHFGLKAGGTLVLGPSESPGDVAEEFDTIDGHWKIYSKRRDVRLATDMRLPMSPLSPLLPPLPASSAPLRSVRSTVADPNLTKAYDELMGAYVPPSLLVNPQRHVLHIFAGAGKYLRVPDGRTSPDVLDMVDDTLRLAISGAFQRALKEGVPVSYGGVVRRSDADEERLKICVRPLVVRSTDETYFLITLEPEVRPQHATPPTSHLDMGSVTHKRLGELEEELQYTKENLQATVEEMETSNEELQATNEELVASNEELQSTNEELHSVNEELYTVNAEYQRKITELTELTDDFDNLLRSTDVGTIFLDRNLLIRKFTPQIAHAFQLLPQDIGRRIDSFAHNILHNSLMDDVRGVLATGESYEADVQNRFGDWFLLRILPYRARGVVDGVVVTLIAISRLKKTEQELRRLSKVFMDGADPIIIEDLSGTIIDLNREAERAYGYSRDELLGKPMSILVPPQYEEQTRSLHQQCLADDSVRNVESMRRDRNGELSHVLITLSMLHGDSGPAAIATISKDIDEQKHAEAEARQAANLRDQFLAMLSHELRNPLAAILNATSLLQGLQNTDDPQSKACGVIERQSKHMARLLDDLLDVARVTQGKIHLRKNVVDLRGPVNEAAQTVQPLVESCKHELVLNLPAEPVFVEGDATRLLQVVENLLSNSAKYTPPGGKIQLSLCAESGEAVVRVCDNGIGIAQEMQSKIFDLFVQAPRTLERFDGSMGIGLTMVRTIVQRHDGRIKVRSEGLNRGSEFEVRLPLTDKRPEAPSAPQEAQDTRLKVLIVEDNADSRDLLAVLLKKKGYSVVTAPDGIRGFETIASQRPDVALVDIGLPGLDGFEVARKVRAELAGQPIRLVALTGFGRSSDREAVFAAGFNEHLVKPVDPADLVRVLRKPR